MLLVEQAERTVLADRQAVGLAAALSGSRNVKLPDVDTARRRLDEWLVSPLPTTRRSELPRPAVAQVLGVGRGR